ncbi:hypothetical protein TSUD_372100 [Trifolium subterraneum]|uniref:Uncharacterized protein n=1 Tax=Trifolium subterraneum TaxID=3900 RepID=A0A2Z6LRN8_TRISU|nr:hypothetical protein TSUD_372100 [Trifolium subterraneum]
MQSVIANYWTQTQNSELAYLVNMQCSIKITKRKQQGKRKGSSDERIRGRREKMVERAPNVQVRCLRKCHAAMEL